MSFAASRCRLSFSFLDALFLFSFVLRRPPSFEKKSKRRKRNDNSPALSTAANWSPLVTPAKGPLVVVNDCLACATAAVSVVEKEEEGDRRRALSASGDREVELLGCGAAEATAEIDACGRLRAVAATGTRALDEATMREGAEEGEKDVDVAVAIPPRACKGAAIASSTANSASFPFSLLASGSILCISSSALGKEKKGEKKREKERRDR